MRRKEINKILKAESGIILLQKKSEQSFFETILNNTISIISAIFLLTNKKVDSLILTEKRIILVMRNKVQLEKKLNGNETLVYNGVKTVLEITDQNEKSFIGLNRLRISYEEGNLIRRKLTKFNEKRNENCLQQ